jgi:hypothetical protein
VQRSTKGQQSIKSTEDDSGVTLATDSNHRDTSTNAPNDRVVRSADCLLDGVTHVPESTSVEEAR